ncbi:MAG: phage tail protein [Bifidobacteriaceae bacterium]|nr:phage tail protein [Bifidobacteriaceae bacterium]
MITFLDENDVEHGALSTIKATNAVNGERSLTGTIVSGDYVLSNIERGWRLRFDDEYYVVTYAKPIDEGRDVQVEFDAVHQFFWDFDKSSVYDQLTDGSHTFVAYLDFIFKNSGYSYTVDSALNVYAFEKQSFGLKKRLTLFNDIITSTGVEFQVNGKVVRILEKVGTDLSTVVRKNFNMNELTIEKNIGDFVTYQKGYGAYFDEEDHSKGRLEVEYTSPLASVYGKLEAEPFVDERYSQSGSLLAVLKENVDNSYTISVSLDMEDLTRAGYKYKQPIAGDYIMAINETLDFQEKIRIVSFTSEYDVQGILVKHEVTCNDIGTVKKLSASYNLTKKQAASASDTASNAYSIANKALISADGKNTNYYGDSFPVDNPKGTLKTGDLLFLTVGDTVKQYYWNGADWVINPVIDDVEAFKEQIAEELKDVPNREEFENKIAEELANSKAEIETKIETAKTQAESNAKEYADTINQETAKVAELANAAAGEIKADLVNVKNNLTATSLVANNAQAAVDKAKQDLTNVTSELNTAKQELTSHAKQLQTQANAQTELTKRVTTVETTANGTKTTVSELSKTVDSNTKSITSVTARTKVVEDDLSGTKTTLSQVKTTADSASQKTATLETGLNGLSAKFETLKIGSRNYFKNSKSRKYYIDNTETQDVRTFIDDDFWKNDTRFTKDYVRMSFDIAFNPALPSDFTTNVHFSASPWYNCGGITFKGGTTALQHFDLKFNLSGAGNSYKTDNVFIRLNNTLPLNTAVSLENFNLYLSAVVEDYSPNEADIEQKVAEYKQNADQNYASLQSTVQALDGTVKQNKSEFDQTASQLKTTISAVEGKIPTEIGGVNLLRDTKKFNGNNLSGYGKLNGDTYKDCAVRYFKNTDASSSYQDIIQFNNCLYPTLGGTYTVSFWAKGNFSLQIFFYGARGFLGVASGSTNQGQTVTTRDDGLLYINLSPNWQRYYVVYKLKDSPASAENVYKHLLFRHDGNSTTDEVWLAGVKLEEGGVATAYTASPLDTDAAITKVSSEIKQTADGMTLLATKTEVNSAKAELQSGINTATNKANNNAQTISTHTTQISALNTGLQAKVSQSEFNTLSGRVTTAENNITAKANELSSKITSVDGKIPSGEMNLVEYGRPADGYSPYNNAEYTTHSFYYNGAYKMYILRNTNTSKIFLNFNRFKIERNTDYTLYFKGFNNVLLETAEVYFLKRKKGSTSDYDEPQRLLKRKLSAGAAEEIIVTFNTGEYDEGYIRIDNNGTSTAGSNADLYFGDVSVKKGKSNNGWSPSLAELASSQDLKTAQSEFKQTTDTIKASVQSLDNNTVKSSSLTINTDGVVIKAGKSTSDFANAVGSYFSVNQNAINLFSDKINAKGNMIVSGAITSDKIASKQINTAHLNGKIITADVISSNAVTADAIKAGAVTTDKMSANSINGDRITAGTLDAAKIKAGSITASQIASGTITSAQIKTGTISAANIAAGAITSDKIASNSIDASKIVANSITADMITGGKLKSTNGATIFDLNGGTLTFNNNYGYIQRVAGDKIFEITTFLNNNSGGSPDYLTSAFNVRKSDNSRLAGIKFTLNNTIENKPTAEAKMNADEFYLYDSTSTKLLSVHGRSTYLGNFNMQGWGDIPVVSLYNGGLLVKDIGIGGHMKSLLKIVEELCNKTGVMWI